MKFQDQKLQTRITNMNNKLLNITFALSFNRKLSKKNQSKLKQIEKSLNDKYYEGRES